MDTKNVIKENKEKKAKDLWFSLRSPKNEEENKPIKRDLSYRTEEFYKLPENVRNAIEISKKNEIHSDFYQALSNLNERILIFKILFCQKKPLHEVKFIEKKK